MRLASFLLVICVINIGVEDPILTASNKVTVLTDIECKYTNNPPARHINIVTVA